MVVITILHQYFVLNFLKYLSYNFFIFKLKYKIVKGWDFLYEFLHIPNAEVLHMCQI